MYKTINFVEQSTKEYLCSSCDETIPKRSSYFMFQEYEGRYNNIPKAKKVCFDCYKEEHKKFRRDTEVKSIDNKLRSVRKDVESTASTLDSINETLTDLCDRIDRLEG